MTRAAAKPTADIINPGSYAASDYHTHTTTILDGIRNISSTATSFMGCFRSNYTNFEVMKAEVVTAAKSAKILALGSVAENVGSSNTFDQTDGEGYDHSDLEFPGPQNEHRIGDPIPAC